MSQLELVKSLQGLRGLAVLYVLASHIGNYNLKLLPIPLNATGKVGVWIFFGLSAYLLTVKLIWQLSCQPLFQSILRYFINRIFRVYPLFLIVLLLHFCVGDINLKSFFLHIVLQEGWGELWAIPTEFQYYILIPFIALAPRKLAMGILFFGIGVALFFGVENPEKVFSNEISIVPKLAPFLLASLLALRHKISNIEGCIIGLVGSLLLLGCTIAFRSIYTTAPLLMWIAPWLSVMLGLAVISLIHAALRPCWFIRILSTRLLCWVGEISFSIYLLHMFVVRAVYSMEFPSYAAGWLVVCITLIISTLSYRWIEVPGIKFGRRICNKL